MTDPFEGLDRDQYAHALYNRRCVDALKQNPHLVFMPWNLLPDGMRNRFIAMITQSDIDRYKAGE